MDLGVRIEGINVWTGRQVQDAKPKGIGREKIIHDSINAQNV